MGLEVRQSALRGAIQVCPLALSSRPGASTHSAIESQQGRALCFLHQEANRAPVAQMDRALASGAKGRGFEPLQARHSFPASRRFPRFPFPPCATASKLLPNGVIPLRNYKNLNLQRRPVTLLLDASPP